jgi:hypothetical protein
MATNNTLTGFDKFISGIGQLVEYIDPFILTEQERLQLEAEKQRAEADQQIALATMQQLKGSNLIPLVIGGGVVILLAVMLFK